MLKEVFRTVTLSYWKKGEPGAGTFIPNWNPNANIDPWAETAGYPMGLFVDPSIPNPVGSGSIFFFSEMETEANPGWTASAWRYDSETGKEAIRYIIKFTGSALHVGNMSQSTGGAFWFANGGGGPLTRISLAKEMLAPKGDAGDNPNKHLPEEKWINVDQYPFYGEDQIVLASHFENMGIPPTAPFGIDDISEGGGVYLGTSNRGGGVNGLGVWNWKTGKWLYDLVIPGEMVAIAMEDPSRVYLLLSNRTVILFDYVRNEVLGANKLPPATGGTPYGTLGGLTFDKVSIVWDKVSRRLLVYEKVPNNADGSSASRIRGYRMVPDPVRLTKPIPLKVPRQGRTIPVLVKVVDDMNQGVGGFAVDAKVAGAGKQMGVPITDYSGNAIIQVLCDKGNVGHVLVRATVLVPLPPVAVSGAPGTTPGTGGEPGGPVDGTDPGTSLPATAPNMQYILDQVYNSRTWNLTTSDDTYDQTAPDGRGAFMDAAVPAIHDVDARFGHIDKNPGQKQFNGHAIDALNFKCDDGTTAEIYDVITGSGALTWGFSSRSSDNLHIWKYPA